MKLSQSNVIFFCLFAAFVIFVTLRGELPKYLDVVFKTQSSGSGTSSGASGGDQSSGLGGFLSDPIGSLAGGLRRSLGIGNGLPDVGAILRGGASAGGGAGEGLGGIGMFGL